ncbi:MAG: ArnT family glycosyltransferase [Limisphaerales bacterium]
MKTEISFLEGNRPATYLGILGVVAVFIALRWNNFDAPLIRDEGEYAYSGQLLIQGMAPYEHAFIQKPPMVVYSYALANLLLPNIFWAPRLLAYVFAAWATVFLGCIARLEWGKGFALPAMGLMTPMILLPGVDQFTTNTEMFMLLPLLATILVYIRDRRCGGHLKYWLTAGFLGVTTLGYKYTALPLLLYVFVVWSVELWRQTHDAQLFRRSWLAAMLGGLMAVVLELGFFLIHDGGRHFWECTLQFNRYYVASNHFGLAHLWSRLGRFWHDWWVLFFIPGAVFFSARPRIGFWVGMFFCAWFATGAGAYPQYYIVVMPFWALLCVLGIRALAARINEWPARPNAWIGGLLAVLVMLLLLRPDVPWLLCSRERFAEVKLNGFPFIGSRVVAKRVAELSSAGDPVYVAGSEPQILFYAQRFSPTRFITAYALMIPTRVAQGYQREAIHDLEMRPPKLVVFPTTPNSWLRQSASPPDFPAFLKQFLEQNYTLVGGYVPDQTEGHWAEPLATNEEADATLLLFQRRMAP